MYVFVYVCIFYVRMNVPMSDNYGNLIVKYYGEIPWLSD